MKKKLVVIAACLIIFLPLITFLAGNGKKAEFHSFKMDTDIRISGQGRDMAKAAKEINDLLDDIDKNLNSHSSEGLLFELNRGEKVLLPADMAEMIKLSEKVREKSDGAFNIAVKPLIDIWGFSHGKSGRVPEKEEIEKAIKLIDNTKTEVDDGGVSVSGGGKIDLGAVAKGYASDKSREILKKYKVKYAILDFGGNIVTYGKKPDGKDFVVGISDGEGGIYAYVFTGETCVVTSGGYERYFEENGKRYHHLLDPHTGYPVENGLKSVTIISENGTLADALSTACFVLGKEKGAQLAESFGVQAVFLDEKDKVFTVGNPKIKLESEKEG